MTTETIVLLCGVALLAVAASVLFLRVLRRTTDGVEDVRSVRLLSALRRSKPIVGPDEVMLVPLPTRRNEALLLGSRQAMGVFERSGLGERMGRSPRGPLPQIVRRVMYFGTAQANRKAQKWIDSGRIVALSEETMEQLKRNGPAFDKAGNMLGLIRGSRGRMKHVMRLDKNAAQTIVASNAATLAMTAALGAQLEHIEQQLTEIRETLNGLVNDIDRRRLAGAVAANQVLQSVADDIQRRGEVTEADWDRIAALRRRQ